MKRKNYVLSETHEDLPVGTSVQPIRKEYISRETKAEIDPHDWLCDEKLVTYAYTPRGIMLIPRHKIREVD